MQQYCIEKGTAPGGINPSPPTAAGGCPIGVDRPGNIGGANADRKTIFFRNGPGYVSKGCGKIRPANKLRFILRTSCGLGLDI